MQRLDHTDIFLKPDGKEARICRLTAGGIVEGERVSVPVSPEARIAISADGWCAAIVRKGRRLWTARITDDLNASYVTSTALPDGTRARAVAIRGNQLYVGGIAPGTSLLAHAILGDRDLDLIQVDLPRKIAQCHKPIDELLLFEEHLVAVDNLVLPKWFLSCYLRDDGSLVVASVADLNPHHTSEHVWHGAAGSRWFALLSSSSGQLGSFRHLTFYDAHGMFEHGSITFQIGSGRLGWHPVHLDQSPRGARVCVDRLMHTVAPIPDHFVPRQVLCVDDHFYLLGDDGALATYELRRNPPPAGYFLAMRRPIKMSDGQPPTLLIQVPLRGQIVAVNSSGAAHVVAS